MAFDIRALKSSFLQIAKPDLFSPASASSTLAKSAGSTLDFPDSLQDQQTRATLQTAGDPLAGALARKLDVLDKALSNFSWPANASDWRTSRTAVKAPAIGDKLDVQINEPGEATPRYKFFSQGFQSTASHNLSTGDYDLTLKLGDKSETVTVTIDSDLDTWGELLTATRDAVNNSALPVQAEVVTQSAPNQRIPGLLATGTALALWVDPGSSEQNLKLDFVEKLPRSLNLDATQAPLSAIDIGRVQVTGLQPARPSTFLSQTVDPGALTDLASGDSTFAWTLGPNSGSVDVSLDAGATWHEALQSIADAVNLGQNFFSARVETATRPVYVNGGLIWGEGERLVLRAKAPKLDERLALADSSGDLIAGLNLSTASPGSNAVMVVDGQTLQSPSGVFSTDQGRLSLTLNQSFGSPLPLRIMDSMQALEDGLSNAVDAYNSLQRFLNANQSLFIDGFADRFRNESQDRITNLNWLGVHESNDKLLWIDADQLWDSLSQDSDLARQTLAGTSGLIPAWQDQLDSILSQDIRGFLRDDIDPNPLANFLAEDRNEKERGLLDLLG